MLHDVVFISELLGILLGIKTSPEGMTHNQSHETGDILSRRKTLCGTCYEHWLSKCRLSLMLLRLCAPSLQSATCLAGLWATPEEAY